MVGLGDEHRLLGLARALEEPARETHGNGPVALSMHDEDRGRHLADLGGRIEAIHDQRADREQREAA